MNNDPLHLALQDLLREQGLPEEFTLQAVPGGGNNRGYEARAGDRSFFLKVYFQHPNDRRDRLGAEYAFTRYAWDRGLRCIPQPVALNRAQGFALYEFVRGRKISPTEIRADAVAQAARFFSGLNESGTPLSLPKASESCFSIEDHLACIGRRVARLDQVTESGPLDAEALRFIRGQLQPAWERLVDGLRRELSPDELAQTVAPCVSPSDFGFHNALLETDGQFRFIDFEYAGQDDPAKMVCDFFCQVAVPVPLAFLPEFVASTVEALPEASACRRRIRWLLPVYQLKWCCIILNDFLPTDSMRRRFAGQEADEETRKRRQLAKAVAKLSELIPGGTVPV